MNYFLGFKLEGYRFFLIAEVARLGDAETLKNLRFSSDYVIFQETDLPDDARVGGYVNMPGHGAG